MPAHAVSLNGDTANPSPFTSVAPVQGAPGFIKEPSTERTKLPMLTHHEYLLYPLLGMGGQDHWISRSRSLCLEGSDLEFEAQESGSRVELLNHHPVVSVWLEAGTQALPRASTEICRASSGVGQAWI